MFLSSFHQNFSYQSALKTKQKSILRIMKVVDDVLEIVNPQSWMKQKEQDESQRSRICLNKRKNVNVAHFTHPTFTLNLHNSPSRLEVSHVVLS